MHYTKYVDVVRAVRTVCPSVRLSVRLSVKPALRPPAACLPACLPPASWLLLTPSPTSCESATEVKWRIMNCILAEPEQNQQIESSCLAWPASDCMALPCFLLVPRIRSQDGQGMHMHCLCTMQQGRGKAKGDQTQRGREGGREGGSPTQLYIRRTKNKSCIPSADMSKWIVPRVS